MDICFVTEQSMSNAWQNNLKEISGHDVLVFGFNGLGLVSYKKELGGETEYFQDLARLSKLIGCTIVCGCDTDTYGIYRHSVVVADKGRILGVTDTVHSIDENEFASGGNYRVYDTSAGKIGIIVAEDLFFPESARALTLCDADIIICCFKKIENSIPQIMLRAGAFANGVLMSLCAEKYCTVADIKGNIKLSSNLSIASLKVKVEKDYHLIVSRRRGMYRDFSSDY